MQTSTYEILLLTHCGGFSGEKTPLLIPFVLDRALVSPIQTAVMEARPRSTRSPAFRARGAEVARKGSVRK
jgi:hypothetical protein